MIDIRSFNKDSNHIYLSQPSNPTCRSTPSNSYSYPKTLLIIGRESPCSKDLLGWKENRILQAKQGVLCANHNGWKTLTNMKLSSFELLSIFDLVSYFFIPNSGFAFKPYFLCVIWKQNPSHLISYHIFVSRFAYKI